ncbi:hypothetical protein VNO77_46264 [Canavalia gladiata]|uniref:Uncharacterized protein n=1 Tax=Canavalia gladiata TaxID=3824 RepID=A0AAN9JF44_CANGL
MRENETRSRNRIRQVRDKPEIQIIRIRHRSEMGLLAKNSSEFPAEGNWLRLVLASTRSLRPLFFFSPKVACFHSDGPATSAHYRTGLTPVSRSAGS